MARLDSQTKLMKMLKFLIGTGFPHIYALLVLRGFNNDTRHEGWDLFYQAGGRQVDLIMPAARGSSMTDLVGAVDSYENEWFDVVQAAVERKFPELLEALFKNLHKSSGPEVVLTIKALLDRIDAVAEQGEQGKALVALLTSRGFTPDVRALGRELLKKVSDGDIDLLPAVDPGAEAARVKAEDAMWAWYLDWSKTARTVVRRKDLRIRLGISTRSRADEEPEPEAEEPVAAPKAVAAA